MSGVLAEIVASKKREVEALLARGPGCDDGVSDAPAPAPPPAFSPRPLARTSLSRGAGEPLRLIAEIKRRSPSAGPLSTVLSPAERALAYARGGASMISVLCDAPFFDGSFGHLCEARRALDRAGFAVPLLAKEFVVHGAQIALAAASGADAVLLIARIATHAELRRLVGEARALAIEPLVEVADEEELDAALATDATLIGVNARDLDTLAMDAARAARVLAAIPKERIALYLSGLKDEGDVRRVAKSSAHGALVGEALMRLDDPTPLLARLANAAR